MREPRKGSFRFVGTLSAMLMLVAGAQAQNDFGKKKFLLTGFVGGSFFDLSDELDDAGIDIDEEVVFGGRFEYKLTPHIGIEGTVGYSPATAMAASALGEFDVDTWDVHGNVVYHFKPDGKFDPFVTGGVGVRTLDVEGGETESFFAGNFGGGVLIPLTSRIAIRAESRFYVYTLDKQLRPGALPTGFDETVWDNQTTGGITISF